MFDNLEAHHGVKLAIGAGQVIVGRGDVEAGMRIGGARLLDPRTGSVDADYLVLGREVCRRAAIATAEVKDTTRLEAGEHGIDIGQKIGVRVRVRCAGIAIVGCLVLFQGGFLDVDLLMRNVT